MAFLNLNPQNGIESLLSKRFLPCIRSNSQPEFSRAVQYKSLEKFVCHSFRHKRRVCPTICPLHPRRGGILREPGSAPEIIQPQPSDVRHPQNRKDCAIVLKPLPDLRFPDCNKIFGLRNADRARHGQTAKNSIAPRFSFCENKKRRNTSLVRRP
jgi:hypothetical protein